ncbi:MAG: hypothetical protein JXQ27_06140 [Acidobacteria bacterium]|nr:hypothetical protein [Acidobacteriota bacterium]
MMPEKKNIPMKLVYPQGREKIRFVNHFLFSQIEMDVVLDIGVVDPRKVMEINHKIQQGLLEPEEHLESVVIQRLGMSISSFMKLKHQIDQIFNSLEKQGVLVKKQGSITTQ